MLGGQEISCLFLQASVDKAWAFVQNADGFQVGLGVAAGLGAATGEISCSSIGRSVSPRKTFWNGHLVIAMSLVIAEREPHARLSALCPLQRRRGDARGGVLRACPHLGARRRPWNSGSALTDGNVAMPLPCACLVNHDPTHLAPVFGPMGFHDIVLEHSPEPFVALPSGEPSPTRSSAGPATRSWLPS